MERTLIGFRSDFRGVKDAPNTWCNKKIPLAETDFTTAPKRFRNKEARSSYYYVVEKRTSSHDYGDGLKQQIMGTIKNPMGFVAWSLTDIAPEKLPFHPIGKACLPFPPCFRVELLNFGGVRRNILGLRCAVGPFFLLEFSAVFWGCHFHHFSGAVAGSCGRCVLCSDGKNLTKLLHCRCHLLRNFTDRSCILGYG